MSRVTGASLVGVDGVPVDVEVRISSRLPRVDIVGLAEAAVRESSARVRAAITAVGLRFPTRRVTVNLAPAGLRKSGAGLDLPIAVAILAEDGAVDGTRLDRLALLGELSLDGRLRPVRGALALALGTRPAGCTRLIVPYANGPEAALAPDLEVMGARHLTDVLAYLNEGTPLGLARPLEDLEPRPPLAELADVRGQEQGKRALEIAAAGGHAILFQGPPGTGKTMLARRLPGLLPPLRFEERIEVTRIHGAAGRLEEQGPVMVERPFRAPHHSASRAGLLGGGSPPCPGEVSLAHRGVLFLDELPEFERRSLEALRQVLEEERVCVVRARFSCVFPAGFQLVAAANPCPCGWRGSRLRDCRCDDGTVARYRARISGPLLDRIDLQLTLPVVPWRDLRGGPGGAGSAEVGERVVRARTLQGQRRGGPPGSLNGQLPDSVLDQVAQLSPEAEQLLGRVVDSLGLSARGARRMMRVARTIADLAGEPRVGPDAMAEALVYRTDGGER